MEANELRIGSWYKNKSDDNPFNQIKYGHEIDYVAVYCEPIPLTKEWLLKFGFRKSAFALHSKEYYIKHDEITNHWWRLDCFEEDYGFSIGFAWSDPTLLKIIKTVNELQNLYFALTGEELTINEL